MAAAPPAPLGRSRSAISVASIISVVASEPGDDYGRHIVIGIDNTQLSVAALAWAVSHLARRGDKFHLVHVLPEPPTLHPWPGVYIPPDDAAEREEFREATALVRSAFAPLVNERRIPTDVHLVVASGEPGAIAALLAEKADDLGAAALVVASAGRSALSEWWAGSVTRSLLRAPPAAPVVVFRQPCQ